jgi:hypothetical protein
VFLQHGAKSFRADERGIAGKNDDVLGIADRAIRDEDRVAGAILGLLQNGFCAERFDLGGNLFRLVANNGNDFFRMERQAGANYVIDERAATGMMEDFSKAGLEACAFASGEDEDSGGVIGHGQSIVHWTRSFDNAVIRGRRSV